MTVTLIQIHVWQDVSTYMLVYDSSQIEHHASARPAFRRARAPRWVGGRGSFANAKHQPWALGRPSAALTRHYNGIAIAILISGSGQGYWPWLRPGNTCGARANGGAGVWGGLHGAQITSAAEHS